MYAWETLNIYSQQHERWFEPVGRHAPGPEHLGVYRALMPPTWRLRHRGLWFIADPPGQTLPDQGWKLHVCASTGDGPAVLRAALPVLRDHGTHCKFLVDAWALASTNGKLWPRGSGGKFVTAYPHDTDAFLAVARALTEALDGCTGPYILGDRRCPGSTAVYYRYGGFTGIPRLRTDGAVDLMITAPDGSPYPDIRHPYWSAPPWVHTDPFGLDARRDPPEATGDDTGGLDGGRFTIEAAITFSNRGGVYRGVETATGRAVVCKEARPRVVLGAGRGARLDATDLLAREHAVLTALADVPQFVDPVALFREWEHTFLVEAHVPGRPLGQVSISANPLYFGPHTGAAFAGYHGRMRRLFEQLAAAIDAAHQRGVVLADLSFTNVLVDDDDKIRIIDVEGAVRAGVDASTGLYTPGVTRTATGDASPADDWHALGAMLFGSVMLANAVVGFHPPAMAGFLAELRRDLALPEDLITLITDLTSPAPPEGAVVAKRLAELPVADPAAWPRLLPLGRPAAAALVGPRLVGLRGRLASTVAGVVRYLGETATPLRTDRLFPADLGLFETNPVSVAFGAAGVLHAMHHLPGDVPPQLPAWLLRRDLSAADLPPGLYLGSAGVAWVLDELGQPEAAGALLRQAADHPLLLAQADVLHGCAGTGLAQLRGWQRTGEQAHLDAAVRIGAHLAATAEVHDAGVAWRHPDGTVPIGYARGASGVAMFLLYLALATGDPGTMRLGRRALDFDLAQARTADSGLPGFLTHTADRSEVLRPYWDQGTAGVLTTLVRFAAATGDDELAGWVPRLLPGITHKYAVLPQQFHGLAGLGTAMLDAAEFTGRQDLVAEALRIAEGVLLFAVDRPEGVAFPGEQAMRETCDFATGSAGVALFLDRALHAGPGRRSNTGFLLDELLPAPVPPAPTTSAGGGVR